MPVEIAPTQAPGCTTALHRSTCPICSVGGRGDEPAGRVFTVKGFPIARCPVCRLLWTDTSPGFDTNSIYTEDYFQGGVPDGYSDYLGSEKLLAREFETRLAFVRSFQPGGRLFEIGCATGGFLQQAKKYFEVQGTDVSEFAIQAAREKGLEVRCGEFEASRIDAASHDVFVLFDTIEHLPDPIDTLRNVGACLRPGGAVFLTTGDSASLMARVCGARWRLMTPPQHLWFFSRQSLTKLLSDLGFEVLRVDYPWRLVPLQLIWYQAFRGGAKPLPGWFDSMAIPANLFDSMMVVARKRVSPSDC
jgi:SAM-dependent methyltransferase